MVHESLALIGVPSTAAAGVDRLLELAVDLTFFGRPNLDSDDVAEALTARMLVHVRRIGCGQRPNAA